MPIVLSCQFSIFGNYNIPPTPDNVADLMREVSEVKGVMFLPNTISSQVVDMPYNRVRTESFLGLASEDGDCTVAFYDERIDVRVFAQGDSSITLREYLNTCEPILKQIMDGRELVSSRLALNTQLVISIPDLKDSIGWQPMLANRLSFYKENNIVEWSTRMNARSAIDVSGGKETVNVITDISSARSTKDSSPGVLYHVDINTLPEIDSMRFDGSSLKAFAVSSLPLIEIISSDIEKIVFHER
ncbi:hypothetical protein [Slackia isoflavoniconvertens]|uniref:hypothetical protein n=1 Tax=Slackia isoflavoniconvertens TaxID=572010 RepID=UPI0030772F3B